MQSIAFPLHLDDLRVREKPIEDGRGRRHVALILPAVVLLSIRRYLRLLVFVSSHKDLQQVFARRRAEAFHADILQDQEIDLREALDEIASLSSRVGFRKVLREIERAAHEGEIAGSDGAHADGHRRVRLAHAGRSNQQHAMMIANEPRGRQIDELCARNLWIEGPVKGREFLHLCDAGLFEPPREEPIGASGQLVLHEQIEEVEVLQRCGLGLFQPERQRFGHAREA